MLPNDLIQQRKLPFYLKIMKETSPFMQKRSRDLIHAGVFQHTAYKVEFKPWKALLLVKEAF